MPAGSITSTFWEDLGPTDLDNMVPICELHHHLVHEGGWTLQLHTGRRITMHRPDGTLSFDGVTTDRITTPTVEADTTRGGVPEPAPPTLSTEATATHDGRRSRRGAPTRPPRDRRQRPLNPE